jgi:hypothetical protein
MYVFLVFLMQNQGNFVSISLWARVYLLFHPSEATKVTKAR